MISNSFKIEITLPTYIKPNTVVPFSILDQVFSKTNYNTSGLVIDYNISDHLPIFFQLEIEVINKLHRIEFRNFSKQKIDNFVESIPYIYFVLCHIVFLAIHPIH